MSSVDQLLARCNQAQKEGKDFPAVWNGILRGHPLILGLPIQVMIDQTPQLKIQLLNGQFLCFGGGNYFLT